MRKRRDQDQIALCELQRSRGIEPPENPHTALLEAHGYRQLMQLVFDIPSIGAKAIGAVSNARSFRIGPPGADAASSVGKKNPIAKRLLIEEFVKKFEPFFEIWRTTSAKKSKDMRGVLVVIGEIHYEPSIEAFIKKVMLGFSRTQGDRFFSEGGHEIVCDEREELYKMEPGDCRLLEKNSEAFQYLSKLGHELNQRLADCILYLKAHIPSAEELEKESTFHYIKFIEEYSSKLPIHARLGFSQVYSKAEAADVRAGKEADRLMDERNRYMIDQVLKNLTNERVNYLIVGADHLKGIRDLVSDRPCIFMTPRSIIEKDPSKSLEIDVKDEL